MFIGIRSSHIQKNFGLKLWNNKMKILFFEVFACFNTQFFYCIIKCFWIKTLFLDMFDTFKKFKNLYSFHFYLSHLCLFYVLDVWNSVLNGPLGFSIYFHSWIDFPNFRKTNKNLKAFNSLKIVNFEGVKSFPWPKKFLPWLKQGFAVKTFAAQISKKIFYIYFF